MSLYNPPNHVNITFNLEEFVSSLDDALTEKDANTLYIRRNGIESVFVGIYFLNKQYLSLTYQQEHSTES